MNMQFMDGTQGCAGRTDAAMWKAFLCVLAQLLGMDPKGPGIFTEANFSVVKICAFTHKDNERTQTWNLNLNTDS